MDLSQRTALTFRHERWRAISAGILETAGTTFLLAIAVKWFHAQPTWKALIASGGSVGLFLTPIVVTQVAKLRWPAALAASRLAFFGAIIFIAMAALPLLPVFVIGSV